MKHSLNIECSELGDELIKKAQNVISSRNLDPQKGAGIKISLRGMREIIDLGEGCYLLIDDDTGDWVVGCFV